MRFSKKNAVGTHLLDTGKKSVCGESGQALVVSWGLVDMTVLTDRPRKLKVLVVSRSICSFLVGMTMTSKKKDAKCTHSLPFNCKLSESNMVILNSRPSIIQ